MPLYDYARVFTLDQDPTIRRAVMKTAGCEVIRAEKASCTRRDGRTKLRALLNSLRDGNTLPSVYRLPGKQTAPGAVNKAGHADQA